MINYIKMLWVEFLCFMNWRIKIKIKNTFRCDLRCEYCCIDIVSGRESKFEELGYQDWLQIVDNFPIRVGIVILIGGEPFFRKDSVDLINTLTAKKIIVKVLTNQTYKRMLDINPTPFVKFLSTYHHGQVPKDYWMDLNAQIKKKYRTRTYEVGKGICANSEVLTLVTNSEDGCYYRRDFIFTPNGDLNLCIMDTTSREGYQPKREWQFARKELMYSIYSLKEKIRIGFWRGFKFKIKKTLGRKKMDIKRLKTFMNQVKNPYLFFLQLGTYKLIAKTFGLNHGIFKWIFPIIIKDGGYKSRYVFQITKQLNLEERVFFDTLKDPKYKVMVDVGSSIGSISDYFLRQDSRRQVYCFEPQNGFVGQSLKVLREFKRVTIYNVALGGGERVSKFYTRYKNDQKGSLVLKHKYVQDIVVKTLDSYSLPKMDLIKYDVEGMELSAIKGSLKTINQWKPDIIFENNDSDDTVVNEIAKLLVGYKIKCLGVTAGQDPDSSNNNYMAVYK